MDKDIKLSKDDLTLILSCVTCINLQALDRRDYSLSEELNDLFNKILKQFR